MRSRIITAVIAVVLLAGIGVGIPRENARHAAACQTNAPHACDGVNLFSSVIDDVRAARESVSSALQTAADQWRALDDMVSQFATATPAK